MKKFMVILVMVLVFIGNAYSGTIATFSDPALNASISLFNINSTTKTVTGGWSDAQTGLNLQVVFTGNTFNDVFFTMTPLVMTAGSLTYDTTGAGTISFFANNANPLSATPLLQIDFDSASVSFGGISGDNSFSSNGVKFSGSEIGSKLFSEEVFAFSFANLKALIPTNNEKGYTATAAFTSSAVPSHVPEPATVAILSIGAIAILRRKTA